MITPVTLRALGVTGEGRNPGPARDAGAGRGPGPGARACGAGQPRGGHGGGHGGGLLGRPGTGDGSSVGAARATAPRSARAPGVGSSAAPATGVGASAGVEAPRPGRARARGWGPRPAPDLDRGGDLRRGGAGGRGNAFAVPAASSAAPAARPRFRRRFRGDLPVQGHGFSSYRLRTLSRIGGPGAREYGGGARPGLHGKPLSVRVQPARARPRMEEQQGWGRRKVGTSETSGCGKGSSGSTAEACQARLRRAAFLLCGDWHQAQDLTQTTLMKLYAAWGPGPPGRQRGRLRAHHPHPHLHRPAAQGRLARGVGGRDTRGPRPGHGHTGVAVADEGGADDAGHRGTGPSWYCGTGRTGPSRRPPTPSR